MKMWNEEKAQIVRFLGISVCLPRDLLYPEVLVIFLEAKKILLHDFSRETWALNADYLLLSNKTTVSKLYKALFLLHIATI